MSSDVLRGRPRPGDALPQKLTGSSVPRQATAQLDYAHFRARVLADCLTEASAVGWLRRAAVFDAARPRPGDFNGRATPDELRARDLRCQAVAAACRHKAELIMSESRYEIDQDVWDTVCRAVA